MIKNRKDVSFGTRNGKPVDGLLHIEVPGCVVNIRTGLRTMAGQNVTNVSIKAEEYAGEPAWRIPTYGDGETTHLGVRVVEDLEVGRVGQPTTPDFTDLSKRIIDFTERYPNGYMHTTFVSGAFDAGAIEYSYSSPSASDGYLYFTSVQHALDQLRVVYERQKPSV